MFNFYTLKNNYKLYNLLEALSLDNVDDYEEEILSQSHGKIKDTDAFDRFIEQHILSAGDDTISTFDEILINKINNDINDFYTNRLQVSDTHQLQLVLQRAVKYFGWEGNYNWIDTSKIESLTRLFPNAFGKNANQFNGDISKWNTSNVKYMLNTFDGCSALKCDISNWNTDKVKYFTTATYANTNAEFKRICEGIYKRLKAKKQLVLREL